MAVRMITFTYWRKINNMSNHLILLGCLTPMIFLGACTPSHRATGANDSGRETVAGQSAGEVTSFSPAEDVDEVRLSKESALGELGQDSTRASAITAHHVSVRKESDMFVYAQGERVPGTSLPVDERVVSRLERALYKAREIESKSMRIRIDCSGGYEVCLDTVRYLYYEEKNAAGHCSGAWFVLAGTCNK